MDVCGHCHEPLPGSTPESEAAEDELVADLRDIALSYVAECPEVVWQWWRNGDLTESTTDHGSELSSLSDSENDATDEI